MATDGENRLQSFVVAIQKTGIGLLYLPERAAAQRSGRECAINLKSTMPQMPRNSLALLGLHLCENTCEA